MSTEAQELHRIIGASVRDMLDAYRLQAQAGPVTDKALEQILLRAAHGVLQSLAPYPVAQRAALLPSVVRVLLAAFLETWRVRPARRMRDDLADSVGEGPTRAAAGGKSWRGCWSRGALSPPVRRPGGQVRRGRYLP